MRKLRMNVQGTVQGVGFRYTTKILADRLGITGAVWNEADGSVGIEAVGEEETMEEFIREIKDSPSPVGRVTYVDITEDPLIKERNKFAVKYR
ncbi:MULTISPECIES: acylphosphatase [Enterococcus]|uniref:acylphosphatase n=1 Tax=Enterococcus TaxID=1350 RepID=UPI00065E3552|nr:MULTISPECIES: acylphosphatase [Enterococcus]KAF1304881.1 acylphosphatase [Enterococcus sp. JM9B]